MTAILEALKNWKIVLAGLIVIGLGGAATLFYVQRDMARADLNVANANLKAAQDRASELQAANTQMADALKQQNAQIDALQADAKARADAAAAAVASAAQATAKYKQAVAARDAKPLTGDACADTASMVDDYLKGLK
ncbi:MAG: hypothetical protein QJR04_25230 [Burkholderia multivorans]|nr:hypothetical protein [Burkholderia multivorans]